MTKLLLSLLSVTLWIGVHAQNYYPPAGNSSWDTLHPARFGWCDEKINELYAFLDSTNSDAFILLKDGKIVLEKYFGTFTKDSLHVWNSAGKTLMATLIGIAQEEGHLSITDTTATYLGQGWTNLTLAQEEKITIQHQLTMTTGLDDGGNVDCTDPNCLTYLSDPGSRWAYHNAPYTLLGSVLENATGQTLNSFVSTKINSKIGIPLGLYYPFGYNRVFVSSPRSMAKYGLLLLSKGQWNGDTVFSDTNYFNAQVNSSQNMNLAYGYLTWLNGKQSYMVPGSQFVIPGTAMPNAPQDVYAALGKNSQIINVSPSKNMVLIRMGDGDGVSLISTQYNDSIWRRINELECGAKVNELTISDFQLFPNPSSGKIHFTVPINMSNLHVTDSQGRNVDFQWKDNQSIEIQKPGIYLLIYSEKDQRKVERIIVNQ